MPRRAREVVVGTRSASRWRKSVAVTLSTALAVTVSLVGAGSAHSSTEDPEASGTITPTMTIAGYDADVAAHESGETLLPKVTSSFVDHAGVTHYAFDPKDLPNAERVVLSGTKTAAGSCLASQQGGSTPGNDAPTLTVATELSFDPETCTHEWAIATYPADDVPDALGIEEQSMAPLAAGTYAGRLEVNIRDPLGLTTTFTMARITYTTNGSCVTSYTPGHDDSWLTASGWFRTFYSAPQSRSCAYAYSNTRGNYRNESFCPTAATVAKHTTTIVRGYADGDFSWNWDAEKSGGCAALLGYHYRVWEP